MNKLSLIVKKAPIPMAFTLISFILFVMVYLFINLTTVEPYWLTSLIFAIPFVSFGCITYFTIKGKITKLTSSVISLLLTLILGYISISSFFMLAIDAATTETTDVAKYQRVLKITNYPNNRLTKYFPKKIPKEAKNITFKYRPAFIQSGEVIILKFEITSNVINQYMNDLKEVAIWVGNIKDSPNDILYSDIFRGFEYQTFPEDFIIYVIAFDNTNHGEHSFVAISKVKNQIVFYANNW